MPIKRPRNVPHRPYYDGHHKFYCLGFIVFVDGSGVARYVHGGLPGAQNDINIWRDSSFSRNTNNFIAPTDYILFDGIFSFLGYPFICPFRGDTSQLTSQQRAFNLYQREARAIIENYFGRLKTIFPIFANKWTLEREKLTQCFFIACALTNLHIISGNAMR